MRDGFVWGAASASYQIEGGVDERGLNLWDMYCRQPGIIIDGTNGDVACDAYHRWKEDIEIMRGIGLKAYRFSISWARVIPDGTGAVSEKGLAYYEQLCEALVDAGITPWVTLFHWDYPYELYRRGGWLNPDSPKWFEDYADVVTKRLGKYVKHWITLNEPQCFIGLGFAQGEHAPGLKLPLWDTMLMAHNALLSHGRAIMKIRENVPNSVAGFAPTGDVPCPKANTPEEIEKARAEYFAVKEDNVFWDVAYFSDPVYLGKYPDDVISNFGQFMPKISSADMDVIKQPLDFCGQNIYRGVDAYANKPGKAITAAKWPISPEALYWGPKFLYERYKKPIVITENGLSCADVVSLDGKVHDPNRIDYLNRYLSAYKRAGQDGAELLGYFQWCLTDNFEWAKGYTERFGIVYCDIETGERIRKDSSYWYSEVIKNNGADL
ncbi:MAG: family 1 glycosylhydrolase [Oscillospiraceae bacterium]|jgi:beta-glucosidase|nr:family 1 glycosylhydrolase [Oscillospiraceae bacterium]